LQKKVPERVSLFETTKEAKMEPPLYQTLLHDSRLYDSVRELDEEIAAEWKENLPNARRFLLPISGAKPRRQLARSILRRRVEEFPG
jgi:hypothetical protein